jgi:hypothetical protein
VFDNFSLINYVDRFVFFSTATSFSFDHIPQSLDSAIEKRVFEQHIILMCYAFRACIPLNSYDGEVARRKASQA